MHDNSEDTPVTHERSVPLFPRGLIYLRQWRTLRWFLILLTPVCISAVDVYAARHNQWESAVVLLFGVPLAFALFVELVSGIASSQQSEMHGFFLEGTFARNQNSLLYWIQVGFTASFYLFVIVVGFALARETPTTVPVWPMTIRAKTSTPYPGEHTSRTTFRDTA